MLTSHEIEIRVRYCETDKMGFLHHANYIPYFEMGRTEMFRAAGGTYRDMEEAGLFLVVVKMEVKYLKPALYDDLLTIRTELEKASAAKLIHAYQVKRDGELLTEGRSTLACVDRDGAVQRLTPQIIPGLEV